MRDMVPAAGPERRWSRARALTALALAVTVPAMAVSAASTGVVAAASGSGPAGGWASGAWWTWSSNTTGTTLADVRGVIGASYGPAAMLTGAGVGVALIDTGVAPVPGLPAAQVVNGPDLSFESQSDDLRYLDTYGHGTHMAGIISANDPATGTRGLAPKAKLTSIKVGTANGAVDASQVIAAIDWVVAHRNDDPANPIRVLNLSYGTGGTPDYWSDPVQFAAEKAWEAGIVVVAAAGNNGNATKKLTDPATDPFVIAVGAAATKGTLTTIDDELAKFTNMATDGRLPDVLAPGESIVSLRDPGSNIDTTYPKARVGETLFRGSGTSQAAAVISAAVALLLQARPSLTPDQVKQALKVGGMSLRTGVAAVRGIRSLNLAGALYAVVASVPQGWIKSVGTGKLEDARGDNHVVLDGVALTGESSIFGPFSSATWAERSAARASWSGGVWMDHRMAGDGWSGTSWASKTWAAGTWSGRPWNGASSWVDPNWEGRYWTGRYWSTGDWSGRYWSGDDWSGSYWG